MMLWWQRRWLHEAEEEDDDINHSRYGCDDELGDGTTK